ncbi:3'-5' exonuclease [Histoplasma capsulatum G186AR]|uniref:3'-5' exonuclease n=1 Tax=Ajellomyces capsulatus TaxID=5037 RepID=A0A8H7YFY7_AJECA|nr:3'-5' exonuclease [Histoplasma capsulatum]QSS72339.1 3'-5' exonuclease [Histoplasma capsulatum G186AR]
MNPPDPKARTGPGRHEGQERTMQSSSPSSLPPSISTQTKPHAHSRRSFRKGKNIPNRENINLLASNNSPGAAQHPPNLLSPTERTNDRNWNKPSNESNLMDQELEQPKGEQLNTHFPPSIPISAQTHPASVRLAIRLNQEQHNRSEQPPHQPLSTSGRLRHTTPTRGGSSLIMRQIVAVEQMQEGARSILEATPEYMFQLNSLVANLDSLRQAGYVLNPLSMEDLELKKRCSGCGMSMGKYLRSQERRQRKEKRKNSMDRPSKSDLDANKEKTLSQKEKVDGKCKNDDDTKQTPKTKVFRCKFHPGTPTWNRNKKIWSCCGQPIASDPCGGAEQHHVRFYRAGDMTRLWQFHPTPRQPIMHTPDIRAAVAIDCEMGQAASGDSELIRITLIDYFSSAVLIDSLVYPSVKMEHYRTRFSGVSRRDMEAAKRAGSCIMGRDNARFAVWRYVGPETVVVGHSAHNDLESLRWIHTAVVDTYIIEDLLEKKKNCESKKDADKTKDGKVPVEADELLLLAGESAGNEHEHEHEHELHEGEESEEVKGSTVQKESSNPKAKPDDAPGKAEQEPRKKRNKGSGSLSLKTLARVRLGRDIQNADKKGHDSLEDALAARDLAHWHIANGERAELDKGKEGQLSFRK